MHFWIDPTWWPHWFYSDRGLLINQRILKKCWRGFPNSFQTIMFLHLRPHWWLAAHGFHHLRENIPTHDDDREVATTVICFRCALLHRQCTWGCLLVWHAFRSVFSLRQQFQERPARKKVWVHFLVLALEKIRLT